MHKLFVLMLFKGADQTVRMRRLVCAFVVHKLIEDRVSRYPESDLIRIKNNNVVRLDSSSNFNPLFTRGERITISVDN